MAAAPGVMHDEMDKLVYLRGLGAEGWDLSALPPRRVARAARRRGRRPAPRLLNASDGAWRWLRVQVRDTDGSFLRSDPYELHFPTGGEAHRPLSA